MAKIYVKIEQTGSKTEYIAVKQQKHGYAVHSNRGKDIKDKYDGYLYGVSCISYNINHDNIKKSDEVIVYLDLSDDAIKLLNQAHLGRHVYKKMADIKDTAERACVIKILNYCNAIYVKNGIAPIFKNRLAYDKFDKAVDYRFNKKTTYKSAYDSYQLNKTDEQLDKEIQEQEKNRVIYDYNEIINR